MPSPTDGVPGPSTYASNVAPVAAPAPATAPSTKPGPNPRSRMTLLNKKHSQPLPIALPSLPRGPTTASTPSYGTSILSSFVPSFLAQTASRGIELPTCVGTFDPPTRSVWVTDQRSKEILFNSGFFGKGSLSRSEPSWRQRRVDLLKGGECECGVARTAQLYPSLARRLLPCFFAPADSVYVVVEILVGPALMRSTGAVTGLLCGRTSERPGGREVLEQQRFIVSVDVPADLAISSHGRADPRETPDRA